MTIATAAQPVSVDSRTLIVGAAGFIGRFVTEACLETGRTTYVLVRSAKTTSSNAQTIKALHDKGAIIVHGSINDQEFMERLLRENKIDVVISAVGGESILPQLNLIDAIKAVGTVKRFLPSEFGHDIDRADPVEPGLTMYKQKRWVRRAIEEARIPFTYICCNSVAAWPYHDNTHPSEVLPPLDRFQIYGDGSVKAYFVAGTDIGKFTMKAVDDERTVNKSVHFRPATNFLNINELASLWEKKIGRTLPRETVTEEDLLVAAAENVIPRSVVASFTHDIFIKGCQTNFPIDGQNDLETSSLYPDTPFRSMADCFDDFAAIATARVEESAVKEELPVAGEAAQGEFVMRIDQQQQQQVVGEAPNPMVEVFAITASCA
ncbi:leucoanthocyanidin reductase-like [Macadamia integrifolia]|uniref:leucoanthocyanidin reductase-like n=1 Tax=Macadamia integrifolia TaxID=60698 RepID=UPI001C4E5E46|nr:leucoanthocyanidin reductase-like [Macadamia integrifolia]